MSAVISLKSVVEALQSLWDESQAHVNRATGEVRVLGPDELAFIESEEAPEGLPPWQIELVQQAREVYNSEDWLRLPSKFDIHEWNIMEAFASTIRGESGAMLGNSLRGSGAFGRFQGAIRILGIEQAWYRFRDDAFAEIARTWLREHDLPYK
ncbi:MAG: hypothetical protein IPK82_11235 [Polyangiaceae bacterium]|nr:hypothetical protein [Polyangiaceae bacterium]